MAETDQSAALLCLRALSVRFRSPNREVLTAVDEIDLTVTEGEVHGLIGESGCGKTVTALATLGLIDAPGEVTGDVIWQGQELRGLTERELQRIRGHGIAMVFQDAVGSLNPALRVGTQLREVLKLHQQLVGMEASDEAERLARAVRLPDAHRTLNLYPHECSGGMAQRVAIALALACRPKLLIADEPTSALDVTIAAQIVDLLRAVHDEFHFAILLISHDLGIVRRLCNRVSVMYLGKIVESGPAEEIFSRPLHPYTVALIAAASWQDTSDQRTPTILAGEAQSALNLPTGCRFHPRCPRSIPRCQEQEPPLESHGSDAHLSACWVVSDGGNTPDQRQTGDREPGTDSEAGHD